jgi:hypothetical protein
MPTQSSKQPAPTSEDLAKLLDQMKEIGGTLMVVDRIKVMNLAPKPMMDAFLELGHQAYWKKKDLPSAITFSRTAMEIGQAMATKMKTTDPAAANQVLGVVKGIAFNLASFTWPGWDEPGIVIGPDDLAMGRKAAQLNFYLALELKRPPDKVAVAHWLMGAHALAAGQHDQALKHFESYQTTATDETNRLTARGYSAITKLAAGRESAKAKTAFDDAVTALKVINSDDSKFFAEQLVSVRKVLVKGG